MPLYSWGQSARVSRHFWDSNCGFSLRVTAGWWLCLGSGFHLWWVRVGAPSETIMSVRRPHWDMETSVCVSDRVDYLVPLPQKHTWHKHMKNCVFLFTEHSDVLENNQKSNILALFVPPPGGKRLPRSDTHSGDVDCSSVKVWTHPLDVFAEGLAEARAEDLKLDVGVGAVVLKVHRTCQTCDISLKRRVADREERDGGLEVTQDDLCSPSDTIRLFPEPSDAPLSSFITLWRSLTRAATFFHSFCWRLKLDLQWVFEERQSEADIIFGYFRNSL